MILTRFHSADPSAQLEHVVETSCELSTVLLSEHAYLVNWLVSLKHDDSTVITIISWGQLTRWRCANDDPCKIPFGRP